MKALPNIIMRSGQEMMNDESFSQSEPISALNKMGKQTIVPQRMLSIIHEMKRIGKSCSITNAVCVCV